MAEGVKTTEEKAAEARRGPARRGGPPHMQMGQPGEKSLNFGPSAKRLLGRLRPHRAKVVVVLVLAVVSVAFSSVGPKILGRATDLIFAGVIGGAIKAPPGTTKEQVIDDPARPGPDDVCRPAEQRRLHPGAGHRLRRPRQRAPARHRALRRRLAAHVGPGLDPAGRARSARCTTCARRSRPSSTGCRCPYFDNQPRGELLSRVTNDIDNVGQSLQQTLSQLLNSLLTVVAVLGMMFWISWMLALIALVSIPISIVVTSLIAKRSQKLFIQQWRNTGELNGIVEETFTGHGLVKVYGRQKETEQAFKQKNDELYEASFGAQFISGIIMPVMMFVGNLNYVAHRRRRRPPGRRRAR